MRRRPAPGRTGSCPWRRRREPSRVRSAARPVDAWGLPWSVRSVHGAGVSSAGSLVDPFPCRGVRPRHASPVALRGAGRTVRVGDGHRLLTRIVAHRNVPGTGDSPAVPPTLDIALHPFDASRTLQPLAGPAERGPTVGLHRFAIVRPPLRGRPPAAVVVRRGGSGAPGFRVESRASPAAGIRDQERCPPPSSPAPAMPAARPRSACVRPDTKAGSSYAEPSRSRRISARRCRRSTCPASSRWSGCSCDRRASGPETTSSSGSETRFGRSIRIAGRSCSKTGSRWRSRTWSSQPEAARADSTPRGRTSATSSI